jgi:hypothetical protein
MLKKRFHKYAEIEGLLTEYEISPYYHFAINSSHFVAFNLKPNKEEQL